MRRIFLVILLVFCGSLMRLFADNIKVTLKSGVTITGDLKELVTTDHITLIIGGVESIISMDEVSSIEQMNSINSEIQGGKPHKLVYGQYQITDTKQYPDSFVLNIGDQKITMLLVRGGWFNMGYDDRHSWSWGSEPVHRVLLSSFYVSKQLLNRRVVDYIQQKKKPNTSIKPFGTYSRKVAETIINQLASETKLPYRLITEAEWEYFAIMPFAESIFSSQYIVEWCSDYYGDYLEKEQINPQGPSSGNTYVVRSYSPDNKKWKRQKRASTYSTKYGGSEATIRIAISADSITLK